MYDENGVSKYEVEKVCEISNLFTDGFDAREPGDMGFFSKETVTVKIKDLGEERDKNKNPALKKGDKIKIIIKKIEDE